MVGSSAGSKLGSPLALRPRLATDLPFTVALTGPISPSERKPLGVTGKTDEAGPKARLAVTTYWLVDYQLPPEVGQPPPVPVQVRLRVPSASFSMKKWLSDCE
jgi:hypothetical protein